MTKGLMYHKGYYLNVVMYYMLYNPVTLLSLTSHREVHKAFTPVTCEITGINMIMLENILFYIPLLLSQVSQVTERVGWLPDETLIYIYKYNIPP